jgi:hypothetical protein
MKKLLLPLFYLTCLSLQAQVSLAPTTVFMDANGVGTLFVTNGSEVAQEINVSFLFGYLGNDADGNALMIYSDSLRENQYGLKDRIRTFPRSFILPPGQQQSVRLQVRPDRSAPTGTYFTRVKVLSNPQTPDIALDSLTEIGTKINVRFEQIIAAFYKNGTVSTGLDIQQLEATAENGQIQSVMAFETTGNSPYLGSLNMTLYNNSNQKVAEQSQNLALYFGGKRNFTLNLPEDLPAGSYTLSYSFDTSRPDIASSDLIKAAPLQRTVKVLLP